ncbi:hypothetical protein ACQ4PT_044380 [Festuca glaucescens]
MVVVAPTAGDRPHQLGLGGGVRVVDGPAPPVELLQVVGETAGKQVATARVLVEGFAVLEPPVDAEEAAERADDVAALLAAFGNHLHERTAHHLGYPYNLDFDFSVLAQFQNFSINNLGDPFIESNYGVHSRQFEVAVLDWFARLWDLQQDEYWGYITNCGTTVKGAIDDLDRIIRTLEKCGFKDRFYIHCDGALAGLMMPFIKQAPKVTFKKPIGSVSVSGHKFIGCPVPCGIVITRLEHVKVLSTDIEYLSSRDATIMGSRNGHAPMFLWYTLNKKGYKGIRKEVQKCLRNAHYLANRLKEMGVSASLNALSNTVVFERPRDEAFVHRWQLACEGSITHVVVMPNVSIEKLDGFVEELVAKRSSWHEGKEFSVPCVAKDMGAENCLCSQHNKRSRIA